MGFSSRSKRAPSGTSESNAVIGVGWCCRNGRKKGSSTIQQQQNPDEHWKHFPSLFFLYQGSKREGREGTIVFLGGSLALVLGLHPAVGGEIGSVLLPVGGLVELLHLVAAVASGPTGCARW